MKLNIIFVLVLVLGCKSSVQFELKTKYLIPRNCSEIYSTLQPKYVAYDEPYRVRNWVGLYKWKVRTNYRVENQVIYKTRSICCYGYTPFDDTNCTPLCTTCRDNQICTKPEVCECLPGYKTDPVTSECQPVCSKAFENGKCVAPEQWRCLDGYQMLPDNSSCIPICINCSNLEECIEPHVCKCKDGWTRSPIERLDRADTQECKPVCQRECKNSECVEPNRCECHDGYENLDDDVFTCEPKCSPACRDGTCVTPNTCSCFEGYSLATNSSHLCEPVCENECINGECISPNVCSCYDGYVNTDKSNLCEPYCSSCTHGRCAKPEICVCDEGYTAVDNETRCEPVCSEACVMGNCTGPEECTCFDGYKLSESNNFTCIPSCKFECMHGICTSPNECTCNENYEFKISTYDDPDSSTLEDHHPHKCIRICECEKGYCNETSPNCDSCFEGYDLTYVDNTTICQPHCESGCKFGKCVDFNYCECSENYKNDNDTQGLSVCVHACGGDCNNGTCLVDNGTCTCNHGWTGEHCEEAFLCSVSISENQTLYSELNEYENLTIFEETWSGPVCHSKCVQELTNTSNCYYENEATNLICFLDIKSQCNSFEVVQANLYKENISMLNYVVYAVSLLVLLTMGTISILFVMRRRKSVRSIEMMKTINATQRLYEHDCLIENDCGGISL